MVYCKKCGKEIQDYASYCPNCGASQLFDNDPYRPGSNNQYGRPASYDSGSFGWAVLGFFFPLVGFILWLVWMNDKPKSGKMAGLGALFSVIICIVLPIVFVVIFAMIGGVSTTTSLLFI